MDDGEGKKWKWGDIERSQKSAPSNCYFCRLLSTSTLTAEEEWCLIWVYFPCVCDFFRDAFCSIVGHCSKYLSAACKRAKWKRGSERLVKTLSEKKLVPCQSVTKRLGICYCTSLLWWASSLENKQLEVKYSLTAALFPRNSNFSREERKLLRRQFSVVWK